jgi:hypothetical protein
MKRADYISAPAMFELQNACVIIAQAYPDGGEFLRCSLIEWCDVCERPALGALRFARRRQRVHHVAHCHGW